MSINLLSAKWRPSVKDLEDMTLRELVKAALRRSISFGAMLDCLYELERRLSEIEAAVEGMDLLDAAVGEIKTGSFEGPWSGLRQHLNAYRAARGARTAGTDLKRYKPLITFTDRD